MVTFVTGASGSGKSAYAESLLDAFQGRKYYLATMLPVDEECRLRIQRHQDARKDRGFETLECPRCLENIQLPQGCAVLLECLSNLASNELFSPDGSVESAYQSILKGIEWLCAQSEQLVVVSNEIFSDGISYDPATEQYLELMGRLQSALAQRADRVVEVVAGIPLPLKGEALG